MRILRVGGGGVGFAGGAEETHCCGLGTGDFNAGLLQQTRGAKQEQESPTAS